jgi:hypothetical protein
MFVSKELLDETIILSDMFSINEYIALDLLCVGKLFRLIDLVL